MKENSIKPEKLSQMKSLKENETPPKKETHFHVSIEITYCL